MTDFILTEQMKQAIINLIAVSVHPNATWAQVNEILTILNGLKKIEEPKEEEKKAEKEARKDEKAKLV
jgi:hypothetical protein